MSIFQPFCATEATRIQGFIQWVHWRLQYVSKRIAADHGAYSGVVCLPPIPFRSIASGGAKAVVQISATSIMDGSTQLVLPQRDGESSIAWF